MKYSYSFASNQEHCEFYSNNYFQINNCGMVKVAEKSGVIHSRPPRVDYMLIYLFSGTGSATINGKRKTMNAGDLLLLKPGAPLTFSFDYNSMHFFFHFTGTAVDDILDECGLNETNLYKLSVSDDIWNLCTDICMAQSYVNSGYVLRTKSIFFEMLSKIADILLPSPSEYREDIRGKKIYPALKDMSINFAENHKINYYADLCGISLSDFQHSFTKITGISPQKYLISIRINYAKNLLYTPSISIKEVALAVGYEDSLYFSRIFKKSVGISPREYMMKYKVPSSKNET